MSREYDYLFQLVIVGNSGVGQSSILLRFSDDQFNESYLTTIGVDFRFQTLPIEGQQVKMQIWDTAGQQRFRTITNAYYQGADCIIFVYDTTSQDSYDDIYKFWLREVQNYADKDVELLIMGNKCDLSDTKAVSTEKVQQDAEKFKMQFFETSAKTNEQIEAAFQLVGKKLMKKREENLKEQKLQRKSRQDRGAEDSKKLNSSQPQSSMDPAVPAQSPQQITLEEKSKEKKETKLSSCQSCLN